MVFDDDLICPKCTGRMTYYDSVRRIVKTKRGVVWYAYIKRYECIVCGSVHRCIPNYILPYKHYETEVVAGVIEGLITSETLGYEDYPSEKTMERWRTFFSKYK